MDSPHSDKGFSLIEIMLVLVIIALASNIVVGNFITESPEKRLQKQVQRFEVIVNMASDFAILNQQQLGVRVDKEENLYIFMLWNDQVDNDEGGKWELIEDELFAEYTLPEEFTLDITLDDLPWLDEDSLFDDKIFDEELSVSDEDVEIGEDEEKPLPPPQIFIFPSGELIPFSVTFAYEGNFTDDNPVYFKVNGHDIPPLEREGPLDTL